MQVLFGGTFDPVHNGHVAMVDQLQVTFPSATIHVIPNNRPPHRDSGVSATHRLEMLQLAMSHLKGIKINRIEYERPGPSYTIDTLNGLREFLEMMNLLYLCLAPMLFVKWILGIGQGQFHCFVTSAY